jgi:hypothetical protein
VKKHEYFRGFFLGCIKNSNNPAIIGKKPKEIIKIIGFCS